MIPAIVEENGTSKQSFLFAQQMIIWNLALVFHVYSFETLFLEDVKHKFNDYCVLLEKLLQMAIEGKSARYEAMFTVHITSSAHLNLPWALTVLRNKNRIHDDETEKRWTWKTQVFWSPEQNIIVACVVFIYVIYLLQWVLPSFKSGHVSAINCYYIGFTSKLSEWISR